MIDSDEERKAILRMMFGRSADLVERYFPEVLRAWGLKMREEAREE